MHHDPAQSRQAGLEFLPYPHGDMLAGRIFEARHIVQIAVIELVEDRRKGRLDVGEVHDPAGFRARLAADMHFDAKRMPVQARALVPRRYVRQPMRGFELKGFEDFHRNAREMEGYGGYGWTRTTDPSIMSAVL